MKKRKNHEDSSGTLGFAARSMTHVSVLPITKLKSSDGHPVLEYTKRNGDFVLTIQASQKYGLPHGADKDLLYFGVSQATKTKSRTIEFSSMRELARQLGRSECGKGLSSIQNSILRLHRAVIFTAGRDEEGMRFSSECRGSIITKVNLPLKDLDYKPDLPFSITFNEEFVKKPIPINTEVIKRLGELHGAKDLYVFLVRRWRSMADDTVGPELIKGNRPVFLEWEDVREQFGFEPSLPLKKVRLVFRKWAQKVETVLKDCDFLSGNDEVQQLGPIICCTTNGVTINYRKTVLGKTRRITKELEELDRALIKIPTA